jgi:Protein of unknown function (DUF3667)
MNHPASPVADAPIAALPAAPPAAPTPALTAATATTATPAAAPAAVPASPRCENCGAPLSGRFCAACGQRAEPPLRSLWHFIGVATEDITHADSRLWRTLAALLFKPGFLTRQFLHGHRASYLPPVRLYLVLSVVFFIIASSVQTHLAVLSFDEDHPSRSTTRSAERLDDAVARIAPPRPGETPEQRADRVCAKANYNGPWAGALQPLFRQACRKSVMDNGRELQQAFLHNVPRALFIFLPLLAGVMMLMYWWPRHYYVEHLLLFVHNHAFVFLVASLALLLSKLVPQVPGLDLAIFLYFAWYMYRSMRVVYQQGRLLTLSKLALLAFFYLVFASLMLAITSVYSALVL